MNRLWNEPFSSFREARHAYAIFLETDDYRLLSNHNAMAAVKLMSRQYLRYRAECQAHTNFLELAKWLTENQSKVLLAPLIHVGKRRTTPFTKIVFEDVVRNEELNHLFQHEQFEEEIKGPGWEIETKIYIPYSSTRFEDMSLKIALASFGLYITNFVYSNNDEGRYLDVNIMMQERDFKMDWDEDTWRTKRKALNDAEDDWESEDDLESRIKWIEDGMLDDEDPRI